MNCRLGIFDSGLGGLTVLRRVRERLPGLDFLYFADQRHVPYGDRTTAELRALLSKNVGYLEGQGVDAIVVGCNTSCALAGTYGWPQAAVPILDLIGPAADAVAASGARRVGVLATAATAKLGAYGDAIRARAPQTVVLEVGAPALVPLVEAGECEGPVARAAVAAACAPFADGIDALVLACTHYPLLHRAFEEVLGAHVPRIDPADAQAAQTVAWVRARGAGGEGGSGRARFVTNGALAPFAANLRP